MHVRENVRSQLPYAMCCRRQQVRTFGQHASAPPNGEASAPAGLQGLMHMVGLIEACSGAHKP